jgi:hypothetical protein
MDSSKSTYSVEHTPSAYTRLPIALPDGNEAIPLGSGVITKFLGQGGMAAVYEIWNPQLEMFRAVKIINPGSAETAHQRFQTEVKISAKLKHPNIIEIHGIGEWRGLPFIEMEKVDGRELDNIIETRGALSPLVATSVGIMICRALDYAHQQDCTIYGKSYHGVIHRDIKPANIMVCTKGNVKLMDFGIARPVDVSFQTLDGLVSGTLQYLAPEQIEKKKLDVRTDLYSLGLILYEILTGKVAFPQTSFAELVSAKTKNRFIPIEKYRLNLPRALVNCVNKCIEYDPGKRICTAAELLRRLEKIHERLTKETPEAIMARLVASTGGAKRLVSFRRRFPWLLFAAAVLLGGVAYFGVRDGSTILTKLRSLAGHTSVGAPVQPQPAVPATPAPVALVKPAPSETAAVPKASPPALPSLPRPAHRETAKGQRALQHGTSAKAAEPADRSAGAGKSLIESLRVKYGTGNGVAIMEKELAAKNYQNVVDIYASLSKPEAASHGAVIYAMRALEGLGNQMLLADFFTSVDLRDGEFFLGKARNAFANKKYGECHALLQQSLGLPHQFMDYDALKREAYYYTARCATVLFDADPNESTYKNALDAWWLLRSALRSDQSHPYVKQAEEEQQRIAKKMQKG